jgi:DNA (cytosine-5)-methyltransferase 1
VPGWRIVSLFSGCGGMDWGFIKAGFDVVWANDKERWPYETYLLNIGDHIVRGNIRNFDLSELPDCDVIIGGPPCQPYSKAGKMDPNDPKIDMLWIFADAVLAKRPAYFVMENVPDLGKSARHSKVRDKLYRIFEDAGYDICPRFLNAADFDTAQTRERLFLVGSATGYEACDVMPSPRGYRITVREAIAGLPAPGEPGNEVRSISPVVMVQKPVLRKSPYVGCMLFNGWKRPFHPDRPGDTLMAVMGGNITPIIEQNLLDNPRARSWVVKYHKRLMAGERFPKGTRAPDYVRRLTVRECARIQGFPDDFEFVGPKNAQYAMIGNSVAPRLAYHIARYLDGVMAGRPVAEELPTGPASRSIKGRLAAGQIVTEISPDNPDHQYVWVGRRYVGVITEDDGQWYALRPNDESWAVLDTEWGALKALPTLELQEKLSASAQPFVANPAPGPVEPTMRELGFSDKLGTWRVSHSGYDLVIADLDGGLPTRWDDSVLVTYWDVGEPVEDFETTLDTVRVGLERWRDDDAGVDEIMQYVAVADRVWARNPATQRITPTADERGDRLLGADISYIEADGPLGSGIYVFDYNVDKALRGRGIGREQFLKWREQFPAEAPIYMAVTDESLGFWKRLGFCPLYPGGDESYYFKQNPGVTPAELAEWLASPENFMVERGFDPDIIWLYAQEPEVAIQNLIGEPSDYSDEAEYKAQYHMWQADFARGVQLLNRMERAEAER